jgi:ribonuclease E
MLENTPGSEPTPETTPQSGADSSADAGSAAKKAPAKKAAAKKASAKKATAKKAAAKKAPAKKPAAKKTAAKKAPAKKAAAKKTATDAPVAVPDPEAPTPTSDETRTTPETAPESTNEVSARAAKKTAKKASAKRTTTRKSASAPAPEAIPVDDADSTASPAIPLFQAPVASDPVAEKASETPSGEPAEAPSAEGEASGSDAAGSEPGEGGGRRRRRRGGRRRRKSGGDTDSATAEQEGDSGATAGSESAAAPEKGADQEPDKAADKAADKGNDKGKDKVKDKGKDADSQDEGESTTSRRRRRRRRAGEDSGEGEDDPQNTVTRVRKTRAPEDQITALSGSTRLEAKKQRRREGREAGRRRAPIVSEAEFLARRESVERVMAIRQRDDLTQIAVLEDKVLVEHYVARESQTSLIGNVYLGRVQNVLPSMEAAFIDIGKGRNAVLYAGEVNWSALGHKDGQPRKIESVLSSGQSVLVQVTKDPVGHKGARLTSQISLAGRFLVYVPDGTNSGISRKLPDTERSRLKALLKEIVPEGAGVIVRTAAEGASEEELTRDVERLTARWNDIEKKAKGSAPQLLYGEPDLMLKVVRDLFTEDFAKLVVQGDDAWDTVHGYVTHVAPDLLERLERHDDSKSDLFTTYRIDEQIHKGLDRKVWLPSGGSLIIDRTEAMTVVDVNTGKFTGSGGNLEETVTKNNLEAAEEIVRQLRLRDIGGIIVVDFIDMVLESNRDLVLRRLVECLGRDRTRHQVAEVTSLGLVQMTRKRIGTGLLEAFSEPCEHCGGRGLIIADAPIEPKKEAESRRSSRRSRGGRGRGDDATPAAGNGLGKPPTPKDIAAMARPPHDDAQRETTGAEEVPVAVDAQSDIEDLEPLTPMTEEPSRSSEQADEPVGPAAAAADSSAREAETASQPEPQPEPQSEPEPESPETTAEEVPEPAPPARPKVVTRTRRRSASRPAGPPAATTTVPAMSEAEAPSVVGQPAEHGAVEPGTADAEAGGKPVVEHVPVKKRGSRKR